MTTAHKDFVYHFEAIQIEHAEIMRANGFYDGRPKDVHARLAMLMLMVEELGECCSGVRKDAMDDHLLDRKMEVAELADVVLRIMDYCTFHGLPVAQVIIEKMQYNATRPYRHGDKQA